MAISENLKKIYRKTYITFFIFLFLGFFFSLFIAFFSYSNLEYHIIFFYNYFITNTLLILLKNLLFITLLFIVFCYSIVINKGDTITKTGSALHFYQIVSRGLYIVVFLTCFFIFSTEILIPMLESSLETLKNSTLRANTSLLNAKEAEKKGDLIESLTYYNEYLTIIPNDWNILDKTRELKNKIGLPKKINSYDFENLILKNIKDSANYDLVKNSYIHNSYKGYYTISPNLSNEDKNRIWQIIYNTGFFKAKSMSDENIEKGYEVEDTSISTRITDYSQLADIYFDKKDYLTAWFYYQHMAEADKSKRKYALERIALIKKGLRFQRSDLSDKQFEEFLTESDKQIKKIYSLKKKASESFNNGEYQKAYFYYNDILYINRNLRDAIEGKNLSYEKLKNSGVELSEILKAQTFSGKQNFLFFADIDTIVLVDYIVKKYDNENLRNTYYLYNVKIINFDSSFKNIRTIFAKYGQTKSLNTYTLYCYDLSNRENEFYPVLYENNVYKGELKKEYIFRFPVDINTLYNFSYNYSKALNFSLLRLLQLNRLGANVLKITNEFDINEFENFILPKIKDKKSKELLLNVYKLNQLTKKYYLIDDITEEQKSKLIKIFSKIGLKQGSLSIGFNVNFIKTAIVDKISRFFMFFYLSLFFITLSWRLKVDYFSTMKKIYLPFLLFIPFFIFFLLEIIYTVNTLLCSIMAVSFNFELLLLVSIIFNLLITIISTIFLSANSV